MDVDLTKLACKNVERKETRRKLRKGYENKEENKKRK
jgi:hypothetical protein